MRIIITGGGTGGHIYPAVAIAKRVRKAIPDCKILYVGGNYGLEKNIVTKQGLPFKGINVRPFDRQSMWRRIKAYLILIVAFVQSFIVMRKFKPDLVIGTGGYVSGPVVLTASKLGIDTMIHEQNVIPGMTTKFLSSRVKKVLVSFKSSMRYFKSDNNLYYTGVPIREEFLNVDKEKARAHFGLDKDDVFVVSIGGSNGAKVINDLAKALIPETETRPNFHYTHVTGKRFYDGFVQLFSGKKISPNVNILDYVDDLPLMYAAADLVISRAGALSLAEFKAVKLPSLLIPSPNVADDHQMHNAKAFEKNGAAVVVDEKQTDITEMLKKTLALIDKPSQLKIMRDNYGTQSEENALNAIMAIVASYHLR